MCIQLNYKETLIKAWFLCGAGAVKVFLMSITSAAHLGLLSSVEFQKRRLVMRCATGPSARNLHKILWNFVWKASAVCPAGCPASAQGSCTPLWSVCSELGADKMTYKMTSRMLCWDGAPHKCQNRPWSRSSSHDSSPVFLLLASMREWGGLWSLQGPSWTFKCWKLMLGAWWEFCWLRLHPFHVIVKVDLDRFILHLYFWFVHIIRMLVSHLVLWYVRNKGINKTILLRQHGWDIFLLNWWAWFPLHLLLFFIC